jgi:hypothetical protein
LGTFVEAVLAFLFTVVLGTRIAHVWQARAAKEARFFEASSDMYRSMSNAAELITTLVGRRIYASQRLCLATEESTKEEALKIFRQVVVEWNERLLEIELAIRSRFRDSYLTSFEHLQSDLAQVSANVLAVSRSDPAVSRSETLTSLKVLRNDFFVFIEGMLREARLLHRQMHFGVRLQYERDALNKLSTLDLLKLLISPGIKSQGIVRSPSDFGQPVSVRDARFGIYE